MKSFVCLVSVLWVALVLAGCGGGSEAADTANDEAMQQGLSAAGLTPIPCDDEKNPLWTGTRVELLVADAWAACAAAPNFDDIEEFFHLDSADEYLSSVEGHMFELTHNDPSLRIWRTYRSNSANNCDPSTGVNVAVDLEPDDFVYPDIDLPFASVTSISLSANAQLKFAPVQLCIAQQLRRAAPGAAGAEAIFFSETEQRELLSVIRERSQLAMLNFGLLASLLAADPYRPELSLEEMAFELEGIDQRLPMLQRWALEPESEPALASLGQDFAAAVQLHVMATEELAELMARSRSAGSPAQSLLADTRAEEIWGTESWQQRLMALMYGGDPLAMNGLAPWEHPIADGVAQSLPARFPGYPNIENLLEFLELFVDNPEGAEFLVALDLASKFPARSRFPFASRGITDPQVWEVLRLLRSFDLLELRSSTSSGCRRIDLDATAAAWLTSLEQRLFAQHCGGSADSPHCAAAGTPVESRRPEDLLLWRRHRIRSEHLAAAAQLLSDALGTNVFPGGGLCTGLGLFRRQLFNVFGVMTASGARIQLSPDTLFVPLTLRERAGAFTRIESPGLPNAFELMPDGHAGTQQFVTSSGDHPVNESAVSFRGLALERQRRMGAISALQATRELLVAALVRTAEATDGRSERQEDYLALGNEILELIASAIGDEGISIKPVYERRDGTAPGPDFARRTDDWSVTVTASADHEFWREEPGVAHAVALVPREQWAANIVNIAGAGDPAAKLLFNRGVEDLITEARSLGTLLTMTARDTSDFAARIFQSTALDDDAAGVHLEAGEWTAFALRGPVDAVDQVLEGNGGLQQLDQVRLLMDGVRMPEIVDDFTGHQFAIPGMGDKAHYIGDGGKLGVWLARQMTPAPLNPILPAYDGFGLPQGWVPPATAELMGGEPGQSSVGHLMELARRTAAEARDAVQRAFDGLLDRQADEAALAAAQLRSEQQIRHAASSLCGTDNRTCKPTFRRTSLGARDWYPALQGYQAPDLAHCTDVLAELEDIDASEEDTDSEFAAEALDCIVAIKIRQLLDLTIDVAEPVFDRLEEGVTSVPSFEDLAGGSLQSAYVEQFRAIRTPDEWIESLLAAAESAKQRMVIAGAIVDAAESAATSRACRKSGKILGIARATGSFLTGAVSGAAGGAALGAIFDGPGIIAGAAIGGFSGGVAGIDDYRSRKDACDAAKQQLKVAEAQEVGAMLDAFSAVVSAAQGFTNAQASIVQSTATIKSLSAESELARERAELEAELTRLTRRSSFGLYRQYRAFDLWRAKALVENARRFALAARRSIEARFVVDLSSMTADEAFVASPATWANEVYEYDLSLPAAVGLTVGPAGEEGVFPNKIVDYVGNLEAFLAGYSVERPTTVAQADIDVIYLPGTAPGPAEIVEVGPDFEAVPIFPEAGNWTVRCPESTQWDSALPAGDGGAAASCTDWNACPACMVGDVDCAIREDCYVPPAAAQLGFSIDPWGRLNGVLINEPMEHRYNGRWSQLAVNLVGTGVLDCSRAPDPLTCFSEGFVRYDLVHVGPAMVTDFVGRWRALNVPTGRVESGKALAAELWLDPLRDGWQSPFISAVARTELAERPLGGEYVLEIKAGPTMRLDRVERVQLLVGQSYWVAQR